MASTQRRRRPVSNLADRPKIGRPARLDRAMIARAAYEIGLDRVTMKAVADRLGVSVPGLYHHVEGRDDLMRLGAEYSAAQIQVPIDHGQHWTAWLLEWARYSHDAFVAQPALLGQFLNGSLGVERMVAHMEAVLGVLTRQGFTVAEAVEAYGLVGDCAVGTAVAEIRREQAARAGHPIVAEYHRVLAGAGDGEYPNIRNMVENFNVVSGDFVDRILTVLIGISVRRGEPWQRVAELAKVEADTEQTIGMMHP